MLQILLAIVCGIGAGIITGLIPGVHINLISIIVVSFATKLPFNMFQIVIFIISMSVTHTFLDFIPSIFLGVPEGDTALSVLPGHRMVLEGYGYEAVKLTVIGSFLSTISSILIFPLLVIFFPIIFAITSKYIVYFLLFVVLFMILREKGVDRKFWSFIVFMLSGILGYIVLNFPNLSDPLLPMLSGLFGISMLFSSLFNNTVIPVQHRTEHFILNKKELIKTTIASTFSGGLTGLLPGVGASQASIIGSIIVGKISVFGFLVLQGGINTVNFILSLVTFYTINKARNGSVIAVQKLITSITMNHLLYIFCSILIVAGLCVFVSLYFASLFSKIITKINYQVLCISVILLVTGLVFFFSGYIGLLILFISTMLGLVPSLIGVGKNHAMGCILLPVILYFI